MLKYALALLCMCAAHAQDNYEVKITYTGHRLDLLVHIADNHVSSVLFHYGLKRALQTGQGVRTANGWQYQTDLTTHTGNSINAFAEIHYNSGLLVTTPQASVDVRGSTTGILPPGARRVRAVTFRDDFNNYNQDNWSPEVSMFGGYNWEFQVYTPETRNIYAANGHLYLRPTLTTDDPRFDDNFLHTGVMDVSKIWGYCTEDGNDGCYRDGHDGLLPPVMSGKVSSNPTIRFGTVEIRAKIPRGDWLWPAIWMMPKDNVYGYWPKSGEIDIMESWGNAGDFGVNTVTSTLHWGPTEDQNRMDLSHGEITAGDFSQDFHTWRLDWTEDYLRTYVDDKLIMNVDVGTSFWVKGGFSGNNIWAAGNKAAPFDQDFYIMFNVAVGTTDGYFPDDIDWGVKKPWLNTSPHAPEDFYNARGDWLPTWKGENAALQIDYVEFRN